MTRFAFHLIAIIAANIFAPISSSTVSNEGLHEALSEKWDTFTRFDKISTIYGKPDWNKPPIEWENIVLIIEFELETKTELVKAVFDTWLRRVGVAADIVFITDGDDTRSINDFFSAQSSVRQPKYHIYKSEKGEDNSNRLKFKSIDGFRFVSEMNFSSEKKYFLKMDVNTYVRPERLLTYLNNLHIQTYPRPVHFGKVNCVHICHTEGGIFGFNDAGLKGLLRYFTNHYDLVTLDRFNLHDKLFDLMEHEEYMVPYIYNKATQLFMIHNPLLVSYKENYGISYHPLQVPEVFYEVENTIYQVKNNIYHSGGQ